MPGLRLHLTAARQLGFDVARSLIEENRGAFYLGATTPDIRALTRWDRERTHFFRLDDFEEQSGVHRLFEQEPALREVRALDPATAAFMAGYISHLVMDEDYICQIYRPLFGERSALSGDTMADVMDKALQWDIERSDPERETTADEVRRALAEMAVEMEVSFIGREMLLRWRDISLEVMAQPPTIERFVRFVGRRMPQMQFEDEAATARFAEEVPALLRRTWEHVGEERVREYLDGTKARARNAIREYLS